MKRFLTLTLATATILLTACGSATNQTSQVASNYPPDYAWNSTCAYNDIFEVCRAENAGGTFMRIYYKGYLVNASDLRAYVKLNWRDGTFGPFQTVMDGRRPIVLANTAYDCQAQYDSHGFTGYDCKSPSDAMKNLFYYSKDQIGRFNAWDVEVAVVDQDGHWDSNLGGNYKLRIQ